MWCLLVGIKKKSDQGHLLVVNERRGNHHTTGQAKAGCKQHQTPVQRNSWFYGLQQHRIWTCMKNTTGLNYFRVGYTSAPFKTGRKYIKELITPNQLKQCQSLLNNYLYFFVLDTRYLTFCIKI